jgi:hypothetical protein
MATRSAGSKTAKTESSSKPASKAEKSKKPASTKGAKRGPKVRSPSSARREVPTDADVLPQAPAAGSFKTRALPLHVNVTHTPPAIPDKDTENASTADPGHLGSLALVPSTFSTGSYGWKGTKRFTVELEDPESADGKTEKVHVMLTYVPFSISSPCPSACSIAYS